MRKTITSIIAMVAMLFASNAMAQKEFTYTLQSFVGNFYEGLTETVDIAAIEAEIGCEIANAQINVLTPNGDIDDEHDYKLGQYQVNDTTTADYDGWRDADGNFALWANETSQFYVKIDFTREAPQIYQVGGHDAHNGAHLTTPTSYTASYRIANPETEAYCIVKVVLNYSEVPEFVVNTTLAELEIVGSAEVTSEQFPRKNTTAETVEVEVGDLAQLLGVDPAVFNNFWKTNLLFNEQMTVDDVKSETLVAFNSNSWFSTVDDGAQECAIGTADTKFRANPSYSNGKLSVAVSQNGSLKANEKYYGNFYIVNGNKAFKLTVKLNILQPEETGGFESMTKVGEESISFKRAIADGYTPTVYPLNMDSIAALFSDGVSAADLVFMAMNVDELTDAYTAAAPGFWMDLESNPIGWNTSVQSYFAEFKTNRIEFGHMPNMFDGGEECKGSVFFVFGTEYYEFKINIQIGDKPVPSEYTVETCETVATQKYEYLIVPHSADYQNYGADEEGNTDYHLMQAPIDVDINFITEKLGTSTPTFYGEQPTADSVAYSNKYSCDPNPGFWMLPAADSTLTHVSRVATWGGGNTYGICYANGVFQFFQYPGARQIGDYYVDNFYLVNLAEGKKIKYVITVKYVESIQSLDLAGTANITVLPRNAEDTDIAYETEYDFTAMYEALGCTAEEWEAAGEWVAKDQTDTWSNANYDDMEGFFFTADGTTIDDGTDVLHVGFNEEGKLISYVIENSNVETEYNVQFAAKYGEKMYIFNVTVTNHPADGIKTIAVANSNAATYDIAGRLVKNPTKGLYIQNGKKVLVK